jgi:hypothetical protein
LHGSEIKIIAVRFSGRRRVAIAISV